MTFMQAHTNLLKAIMASAPANVRLFQNDNGTMQLMDGRWVKFGLYPGSGDLIGISTIRGVAVFTSIEGKIGKDIVRPKQKKWTHFLRSFGGIAIVVRSVEECWEEHAKACKEVALNVEGSEVPYGSFPYGSFPQERAKFLPPHPHPASHE